MYSNQALTFQSVILKKKRKRKGEKIKHEVPLLNIPYIYLYGLIDAWVSNLFFFLFGC